MDLTPSFDTFAPGYEAGASQLVYTRLAADLDTPVSLMMKLAGAAPDAFMLESVTGGEVRGRYSIIGMKPDSATARPAASTAPHALTRTHGRIRTVIRWPTYAA